MFNSSPRAHDFLKLNPTYICSYPCLPFALQDPPEACVERTPKTVMPNSLMGTVKSDPPDLSLLSLTGLQRGEAVNPLLIRPVSNLFCFWSEKYKTLCWCGVRHDQGPQQVRDVWTSKTSAGPGGFAFCPFEPSARGEGLRLGRQ